MADLQSVINTRRRKRHIDNAITLTRRIQDPDRRIARQEALLRLRWRLEHQPNTYPPWGNL